MLRKQPKNMKSAPSNDYGARTSGIAEETTKPDATPESKATVIGENISVEGTILGRENLIIEGAMNGNIELEKHKVTIGLKGQVAAAIHAEDVTVSGRLAGNIQAAGKVVFTKEADFNGEIKAKRIAVEDGAYLKAMIELERDTKQPPIDLPRSRKPQPASPSTPKEAAAKG